MNRVDEDQRRRGGDNVPGWTTLHDASTRLDAHDRAMGQSGAKGL